MERSASISRKTNETDISAEINLNGGLVEVKTGVGFFDHMLTALGVHSGFGLRLDARGDLQVDAHHTVEDAGIVLGKAFSQALGDRLSLRRFASCYIPMDEALAFCALDLSGRAFLIFDVKFAQEKIGEFDSCLVIEFMRAFAQNAGITLHIKSEYGANAHHVAEAVFKALAYALRDACMPRESGISSTKGVI